jgi:uncharacterized protein YuzE
MNVTYDAETDTLTILLRDGGTRLSEEARPGVVLDFDADDHLLAIEIQDASRHVDRVDTVQLNVRPKPSISTAAG